MTQNQRRNYKGNLKIFSITMIMKTRFRNCGMQGKQCYALRETWCLGGYNRNGETNNYDILKWYLPRPREHLNRFYLEVEGVRDRCGVTEQYNLWRRMDVWTWHLKMRLGEGFLERGSIRKDREGYASPWNVDRIGSIPICLKHKIYREK